MNRILHDIAPVSEKMIFTCSSEYHVLLSTLLILELGNYDRFYIVMFSPDKKVVKKNADHIGETFRLWDYELCD